MPTNLPPKPKGPLKRKARPTTQYEKDRARSAAGAAKAVEARHLARMLAINPTSRGVAPTKAQTARTARALAADKGKGIRFDDQKVDTSNLKDLRPMQAKRRTQANRPSRGGKK